MFYFKGSKAPPRRVLNQLGGIINGRLGYGEEILFVFPGNGILCIRLLDYQREVVCVSQIQIYIVTIGREIGRHTRCFQVDRNARSPDTIQSF